MGTCGERPCGAASRSQGRHKAWSRNVSPFVARQIGWRRGVFPRRGGRIACTDARFFEAVLCPWTSSSAVYKLRAIERQQL